MQNNIAYNLAAIYEEYKIAPAGQSLAAFHEARFPTMSEDDARLLVLQMHDDTMDLVSGLDLPDRRVVALMAMVKAIKLKFLRAYAVTDIDNFRSRVPVEQITNQLDQIGDTIAGMKAEVVVAVDRGELASSTAELIDWVQACDELSEYERNGLTLKLLSVKRVVEECKFVSDDEIRRKVKAVFAACAADFLEMDKNYETVSEKMLRWAKQVSKPGLMALAITADASAVAPLLIAHMP